MFIFTEGQYVRPVAVRDPHESAARTPPRTRKILPASRPARLRSRTIHAGPWKESRLCPPLPGKFEESLVDLGFSYVRGSVQAAVAKRAPEEELRGFPGT